MVTSEQQIMLQNKGLVTLPSSIRSRYHLQTGSLLIIEERSEGILLKPAVSLPIEFYDDNRIDEFLQDDDAISDQDLAKAKQTLIKKATARRVSSRH